MNRLPFYLLVLILLAAGVGLSVHRHTALDVPWLPGEKQQIWSIESKIEFLALGEAVKVSFAIPDTQEGFSRIAEHTASTGYGLNYVETGTARKAEWTIREAQGKQTLYYRVDMLVSPSTGQKNTLAVPAVALAVDGDGPYETAARALLEQALKRSAEPFSLTRELIREFNTQFQRSEYLTQDRERITWMVALLQHAGIAAREIKGLKLEDGRRRQPLVSYLQVFHEGEYLIFNHKSGKVENSDHLLMWEYHSMPLVDVVGGANTMVSFSMIEQDVPLNQRQQNGFSRDPSFLDFSIHSLPLEEQALFKGILLIPVGVLVVVLMRIFIGLRTSGTFMPVLIAISFIQTSLMTGLIGFFLIVSVGLMIRGYLSRLNLLLVARISAVIICVIILIAALSVVAYQLGLTEGLKITFFPMVILSWTIERMSILWEEEGPHEVAIQGGGSLLVALVTYMLMTNEVVRHLTFNFLGLQLVFMAVVLVVGNYTGYRLLELRRFGPFIRSDNYRP